MSDFYSDFSGVEPSEWMEKVVKDLKGKKPEDVLEYEHPIENISYKAYAFSKEDDDDKGVPNTPPYLRGKDAKSNQWANKVAIPVSSAETTNKLALHHLMNGADSLRIDLNNFSTEDCDFAVKGIGFEYITTTFVYHTADQEIWLKNNFKSTDHNISLESSLETSKLLLDAGNSITIDGTNVQLYGGNVAQEIAWCLHFGHEKLYKLISQGLPIEKAVEQIKFKLGIGGNYFFEIAKVRALRSLWYSVAQGYSDDKSMGKAYIESQTGFVNKSLNDPHTNLLRQTTEALSAVIGGVDELTVLPYNWYAKNPNLEKTQRLATNIGLLLKEESYMDKVIDPSGGSYSIEILTEKVADHAWELFQLLEGGDQNLYNEQINKTRSIRIELIKSKELTHIGVNKYFNNEDPVDQWGEIPNTPFGEALILENIVKVEA